jgi:16S rRNA processing protein RimM
MIDEYIRIAVIAGVHGLAGRLKILVITDFEERFEAERSVFIKINDNYQEYKILEFISQKGKTGLIHLEGINDRNAAQAFKGAELCIRKAESEKIKSALDAESYFYYDIIGCAVSFKGRPFGTVTDILEAGSGEILVITGDEGRNYMVPFVESMVDTKDIGNKKLDIYPVEGLFDI